MLYMNFWWAEEALEKYCLARFFLQNRVNYVIMERFVLIRTTSAQNASEDGRRSVCSVFVVCKACKRCVVRNAPSVIAVLSELVQELNAHVFKYICVT